MKFLGIVMAIFAASSSVNHYDGIWEVYSKKELNTNLHYMLFGVRLKKNITEYYLEIRGDKAVFLFPDTKTRYAAKFVFSGGNYYIVYNEKKVQCFFREDFELVSFGRILPWGSDLKNEGNNYVNVGSKLPLHVKTLDQAQEAWDGNQSIDSGDSQ